MWLLVLAVLPFFRSDHPWHGKKMTLVSWIYFATPLSVAWGAGLWFITATTASAFWCLAHDLMNGFFALALLNTCFVLWMLKKMFP